jgi:hypothetical protein
MRRGTAIISPGYAVLPLYPPGVPRVLYDSGIIVSCNNDKVWIPLGANRWIPFGPHYNSY